MAESWRRRLARGANGLLHRAGLHVSRRDRAFEMEGLLARAARRGHRIATWIDVGASDGSWSLLAQRHFAESTFLLFEPLAERQPILEALARDRGFRVVIAAAGRERGVVRFAIDPALDGSGVAAPDAVRTREVPTETLAAAVADRALSGPYGIKLDTHGFERAVLEGAEPLLAQTELLVIESYTFELLPGSWRFPELCAWLGERGFRCCDLADPMRRPLDGVLWQMDLAFARADHPMFARARYE